VDDSDYPDLGASDSVYEVVRVAGKNQFAWCARFWYPARQWKTGEQFGLADDVIHYMLSGDRIVG
jgi:hypothetical protein